MSPSQNDLKALAGGILRARCPQPDIKLNAAIPEDQVYRVSLPG